MVFELHFQEGFCGEEGTILLDGQVIATVTLVSRPQTGLAHIERLDIKPDQKLQVLLSNSDQIYAVPLKEEQGKRKLEGNESGVSYYLLNLCVDGLEIKPSAQMPGYL